MMMGRWNNWKFEGRLLLVMLSGYGLSLAYPGRDCSICAWLALIPLMAVLWSGAPVKRKRSGFAYGYLFGLAFFGSNVFWITTVSGMGAVLLACYLALYPALWGMVLRRWMNPWAKPAAGGRWGATLHSLVYAFGQASLWAGLEWLRGYALTGFGWNGLGVAMHGHAVMAQCADLFGVAGLSGLMVFVQSVLLQVVTRMIAEAKVGRRRAHPDFGVAGLLLAGAFVYGVWQLSAQGKREFFPLRVCLVQVGVPQVASQQLWSAEEVHLAYEEEVARAMQAVEERNQRAMERTAESGVEEDLFYPDWLVLPEVALTGRLLSTADGQYGMFHANEWTLQSFREQGNYDILVGMQEIEAELIEDQLVILENPRGWNSLVVLPEDAPLQSFQKRHLVMFGEYIPLVDAFPWLKRIYEQQSGSSFHGAFTPGTSRDPLSMSCRGQKFSIIPSICFEDTVPRETLRFVRDEAQVIVNVTNDGWFAQSEAAAQHFANAKFRAIELRRPMVRCANTGVSGVISTSGHAQELRDASGSHFTRGFLLTTVKIPVQAQTTPYQRWGDWPVIVAALLSLGLMVYRNREPRTMP